MHTLTTSSLSFTWPDGSPVFDELSLEVPPGRNALVGPNGSGKSTLLKLLAGDLEPTSGTVGRTGLVGYLPQDVALDDAPRSGGESMQDALARILRDEPDVLLLDEPTNNLDAGARRRLYDQLDRFPGTLLVVSHDRTLLERVDRVADLHDGMIRWYGGSLSDYEEQLRAEQESAGQAVRNAQAGVRREQRDRQRADQTLAGRKQKAQKAWDNTREPRAVMRVRKRTAQVSAAKYVAVHDDRLEDARSRLDEAEGRIRESTSIRVDLPDTVVPDRRVVLRTDGLVLRNGTAVDLALDGPERVALTGRNGSGKTTLLHTLTGVLAPAVGSVDVRVPVRLLPQRLDLLDDTLSVADNVAAVAPTASVNQMRARLARFAFRGSAADQRVATLSGGERFRATLAALLLAEPAPQLLLLDEPTNNLDFASYRQLVAALASYRGALLVASHDDAFLDEIGVTRTLSLD